MEGPSRKSFALGEQAPLQLQGRDPQHRVVNFQAQRAIRPGQLVRVALVEATPHSLVGELEVAVQRRGPLADERGQPAGLA